MCGGGGNSNAIAERAEQQENERQERIKQGMLQIDKIFGGGKAGSSQVAKGTPLDWTKTYYTAAGDPIDLTSRKMEFDLNASLPNVLRGVAGMSDLDKSDGTFYEGVTQHGGFNEDFYNKAYQAQLDYALPQVEDQFKDAQKELEYALARQGISASSQGSARQADLEGKRQLAIQNQQEVARGVRSAQEEAVENERANLVQLLNQTGDLASTTNSARTRADMLKAAPKLETVAPVFQNVTAGLADLVTSPLNKTTGAGIPTRGYGSSTKGSGKIIGS